MLKIVYRLEKLRGRNMKTKEELEELKEKYEELSYELKELSDEEIEIITGGTYSKEKGSDKNAKILFE